MSIKKLDPFGTPTHGKHAYSEFSHLNHSNKDFALQVTSSVSSKTSLPVIETKSLDSTISNKFLKNACMRAECKEISGLLSQAMEKNKHEKENIFNESKVLLLELARLEQLIQISEKEEKIFNIENNRLEKTVNRLEYDLKTLEKRKLEQQHDRDQLNNKVS